MRITDLDPKAFEGATILLDIDGTLVADKGEVLAPEVIEKVRELALVADVHLASNGHEVRTGRLAEELGVGALPRLRKPRKHASIHALPRRDRTVVIGDKFLTDRILAHRLGAEFIYVERLRADTDSRRTRFAYAVDDSSSFISAATMLLRPHQWVKNLLVFAPLFFAGGFFTTTLLAQSFAAFVAFCVAASGVYVLNDLIDCEQDKLHPRKRNRPIACGRVAKHKAYVLLGLLAVVEGLLLAAYPALAGVMLLYIATNILYSLRLKHVAVIDVIMVAMFYILRLEVGSVATGISLSPWIIMCVFFLSLFVITGKRRAEFEHEVKRKVLHSYSKGALDAMLSLTAGLAIVSYAVYTVLGTEYQGLGYSTIFVSIALLRVLNDIYSENSRAETPEKLLFKDPWILGAFLAWVAYLFVVFYSL